jgi:Transglutaminase-like superfamily
VSAELTVGWRMRALAACAVLPPLLLVASFERIATAAGRFSAHPLGAAPDDEALAAYVGRVLRRLPPPWRHTCLRRGIVLYHLLRRAGRPVALQIGVRRTAEGALAAHAWLVKDGRPYLEPGQDQSVSYAPIAAFPEAGRF